MSFLRSLAGVDCQDTKLSYVVVTFLAPTLLALVVSGTTILLRHSTSLSSDFKELIVSIQCFNDGITYLNFVVV